VPPQRPDAELSNGDESCFLTIPHRTVKWDLNGIREKSLSGALKKKKKKKKKNLTAPC